MRLPSLPALALLVLALGAARPGGAHARESCGRVCTAELVAEDCRPLGALGPDTRVSFVAACGLCCSPTPGVLGRCDWEGDAAVVLRVEGGPVVASRFRDTGALCDGRKVRVVEPLLDPGLYRFVGGGVSHPFEIRAPAGWAPTIARRVRQHLASMHTGDCGEGCEARSAELLRRAVAESDLDSVRLLLESDCRLATRELVVQAVESDVQPPVLARLAEAVRACGGGDEPAALGAALLRAGELRRPGLVRALRDAGASPDWTFVATDAFTGEMGELRTPLLAATLAGDVPRVRLLLDLGADPDRFVEHGCEETWSPLMAARRVGHAELVRLLEARRAVEQCLVQVRVVRPLLLVSGDRPEEARAGETLAAIQAKGDWLHVGRRLAGSDAAVAWVHADALAPVLAVSAQEAQLRESPGGRVLGRAAAPFTLLGCSRHSFRVRDGRGRRGWIAP